VIEAVVARAGASFTRSDPDAGRQTLTTVAGLDQMILVFAAREPAPHLRLLDRFLAVAEAQEVAAVICLNKADQGVEPWLDARLAVYRALGYPVIQTSATSGAGVGELRARLGGRVSALLGPSGVGKSSLLNALEPGLGLRIGAVSETTSKGRHTTTGARLVPLTSAAGGYLADTAGIRALGLDGLLDDMARLAWLFREFRPYQGACRHANCRHLSEPGCAARAALTAGQLDAERYESYRRLCGVDVDPTEYDNEEEWNGSD
jgi:ribosome biogenesis GTPase